MQDFDESGSPHFETIAKKSVKGLFALVSRTFFVQLLSVFASFILTFFLDPASFGIFFVVSAIVVFLNYFQDIGLAASLIQKKQEPTKHELRTTFTIQQVLVLAVSIPTAIFAPQISAFYKLDYSGLILLYALVFSFIMSSLKTIPTIMLERRLDFNKLVLPQIFENVTYNLCLIVFAALGFKVYSFTIAVLARSVIGLILIYIIQPWPIGISYDTKVLKKLLSFGIPFQANSFLALLKDELFDVYVAKVLPLTQVGYIGFGQKWAFLPLRLIMDNVVKITFPSFSRLQDDKEALRKAIEKTLFLISICIFPVIVAIILFSPHIVSYLPKYKKWEPALLSLTFFSLSTAMSSLSTPLTNILNAIGKVKITLYFMILWTVLTWIISPIFIIWYGYNGVSIASFLISFSSVLVFIITRSFVVFSMIKPVVPATVASIAMLLFVLLTQNIILSFPMLIVEMLLSAIFYVTVLYLISKPEIDRTVKFIKSSM